MKKILAGIALATLSLTQPIYADVTGAATMVGEELERQAGEDPVKGLIWWIANTFGPNIPTEARNTDTEVCGDECLNNHLKQIISTKRVTQCAAVLTNNENVYDWVITLGNPSNSNINFTTSVWDDTDIVHVSHQDSSIAAKSFLRISMKDVYVTSYMVVITSDSPTPLIATATNANGQTQNITCYDHYLH